MVRLICKKLTQAPFIWSQVPETTLPQVTLGELTFITCFFEKFNEPVYMRITNLSRGEARQKTLPLPSWQVGKPWQAGQFFFKYKQCQLQISSLNEPSFFRWKV